LDAVDDNVKLRPPAGNRSTQKRYKISHEGSAGVLRPFDTADVSAYEQGEKRMSCKLLLETAKQLKATPRFFFQ
jgi:hypothetical protein